MSENDKEIKKTSEAESYEEYEGEGFEDAEEGSRLEETSESRLPLDICQSVHTVPVSDSDQYEEESSPVTYEDRRRQLLTEKWLAVTGKKPKNIPTLRKPFQEGTQFIFFGDKKPSEVEKNIQRRLLIAANEIENKGLTFGKVRREVTLPALFGGLCCVRFDPTAQYMVCANRKGRVEIRLTRTGDVLVQLHTAEEAENLAVKSVRYYPRDSDKIYVVGQTGSVQVFHAETGEQVGASEAFGSTYNMDISSDGNFLATGGKEGKIQVIDPSTLQVISRRGWPGADEVFQPNVYDEYHKMRVYGMRFHQTETNILVTGGWDNTLKIWDVRVQPAIRSISGPAVYGDGVDLKDNVILTASWCAEGSLNLWDFFSGKKIKNVPIKSKSTKFEGEFLYTCRFFKDYPDTSLVAVGGSGFSDVLVMNTKHATIEQYFPSFKPIMCLDISGNLMAYGGTESVFRIAEVKVKYPKPSSRR